MTLAYAQPFSKNWFLDRAVSDDADEVRRLRNNENAARSFYSTHSNNLILNRLIIAFEDAANDDVRGFEQFRANSNSLLYALQFLQLLPYSTPFPEIAIDNDGEIAIEWDFGPRRLISVRIGKDGTLSYASLVDFASNYGVEILKDKIPDTILLGINRVIDAAAA